MRAHFAAARSLVPALHLRQVDVERVLDGVEPCQLHRRRHPEQVQLAQDEGRHPAAQESKRQEGRHADQLPADARELDRR